MIEAQRVLTASFPNGMRFPISIKMVQAKSDFADNEDGSKTEIYMGRVYISSEWISTHIPVVAEDIFVLMYRAMWLTSECLSAEAERFGVTIFQQEPGDADGPLGLFTIG